MSQGIPALTIGSGEGGGTHSEWYKPVDTRFGPSVAADREVSLAARMEPAATAGIIRARLNLRPLAETYLPEAISRRLS